MPTKVKKSAENITSRLKLVMKSGKFTLGVRSTLKVRNKREEVYVLCLGGSEAFAAAVNERPDERGRRLHAWLLQQ